MCVIFRHLEHSQKSHKKKVHNVFLVGLVLRFVKLRSKIILKVAVSRGRDGDDFR